MANPNQKPIVLPDKRALSAESANTSSVQGDDVDRLLRFMIGAVLEAGTDLSRRVQYWESQLRVLEAETVSTSTEEVSIENLGYALLGLIFTSKDLIQVTLTKLITQSKGQIDLITPFTVPLQRIPLIRPLINSLEKRGRISHQQFSQLARRGRNEANIGRYAARGSIKDLLDEFLDYLAHNPEVMEMIQQQSADLASNMIGTVRGISARADDQLERIARVFIRRT
ncbi:MAG: hypothetical protein ACOCX5_01565 [Chloroflexota bacterium]